MLFETYAILYLPVFRLYMGKYRTKNARIHDRFMQCKVIISSHERCTSQKGTSFSIFKKAIVKYVIISFMPLLRYRWSEIFLGKTDNDFQLSSMI